MKGRQNVHTDHDPPSDPTFRCAGCRVGLPFELIRKVAAGYPYCETCTVPDRLPDPTRVGVQGLEADELSQCARCGEVELRLFGDPVFDDDVEVCRECYAEHGQLTDKREVTTDLAREYEERPP